MKLPIAYSLLPIALLACTSCGEKRLPEPTVITGPSGTVWELPADQVKDKDIPQVAGKDRDDIVAVIVVPPSDKSTTVQVYEKPKTARKRATEAVTGTKGSPDYAATSDNKDVKFTTTKERGLWPWLTGLVAIVVALFAARTWLKRFGWIARIFGR